MKIEAFSNSYPNVYMETLEVCEVYNNGVGAIGVYCTYQPMCLLYSVDIEGKVSTRECEIGNSNVVIINGVDIGDVVTLQYFF